jgi:threonine dehydrogenase-like Zn-dependent dehydrogenase
VIVKQPGIRSGRNSIDEIAMGMEQTVRFHGAPPAWTAARDILALRGHAFQVGMIDGQLAFPDEEPPETWRELRLRTPQGMITVRREAKHLVFVTWGNADAELREQWNALAQAFADAGDGTIGK